MTELTDAVVKRQLREIVFPIFRQLGFAKLTPTKIERWEHDERTMPERYWALHIKRYSTYDQQVLKTPPYTMTADLTIYYGALQKELFESPKGFFNKKGEFSPRPYANTPYVYRPILKSCPEECVHCDDPEKTTVHGGNHNWSAERQTVESSEELMIRLARAIEAQAVPDIEVTSDYEAECTWLLEELPETIADLRKFSWDRCRFRNLEGIVSQLRRSDEDSGDVSIHTIRGACKQLDIQPAYAVMALSGYEVCEAIGRHAELPAIVDEAVTSRRRLVEIITV